MCRRLLLLASLALIVSVPLQAQDKAQDAYDLGTMLMRQGKHKEAIGHFDTAIKIKPKYIDALQNRGFCHAETGKYDEAIKDADAALKLNPMYPLAYQLKGYVHQKMKKLDEAIGFYSKAIEFLPTYAKAYNNRGICYFDKSDFDKATADFTDAIKHNPRELHSHYFLGVIKRQKADWQGAYDSLTKAIELNPKWGQAMTERAMCLLRLGKLDEAKKELEAGYQLNPGLKVSYDKEYQAILKELKKK